MDNSTSPLTANRRPNTEITPETRSGIYHMLMAGKTQRDVAKYFNVSQSCVARTKKYYKPEQGFHSRHRSGRPTCLTDRDRRFILKEVEKNPNIRIAELQAFGRLSASTRTIQRFLQRGNGKPKH